MSVRRNVSSWRLPRRVCNSQISRARSAKGGAASASGRPHIEMADQLIRLVGVVVGIVREYRCFDRGGIGQVQLRRHELDARRLGPPCLPPVTDFRSRRIDDLDATHQQRMPLQVAHDDFEREPVRLRIAVERGLGQRFLQLPTSPQRPQRPNGNSADERCASGGGDFATVRKSPRNGTARITLQPFCRRARPNRPAREHEPRANR